MNFVLPKDNFDMTKGSQMNFYWTQLFRSLVSKVNSGNCRNKNKLLRIVYHLQIVYLNFLIVLVMLWYESLELYVECPISNRLPMSKYINVAFDAAQFLWKANYSWQLLNQL